VSTVRLDGVAEPRCQGLAVCAVHASEVARLCDGRNTADGRVRAPPRVEFAERGGRS
jgi:hypothetical protein